MSISKAEVERAVRRYLKYDIAFLDYMPVKAAYRKGFKLGLCWGINIARKLKDKENEECQQEH